MSSAPYVPLPRWVDVGVLPAVNLLLALIASGLVVLAVGENPIEAVELMLVGAFGYEEALGYRPCDPEINEKAARLALELGDLDAAREYAETACEVSPQLASLHRLLGKVMRRSGLHDKAKDALERALEIDPDDEETKSEINQLNRDRRRNR